MSTTVQEIVQKLQEKLANAGKLVFKPGENQTILPHLLPTLAGKLVDWTTKAPTPEQGWTGFALVSTRGKKGEAHTPETRAIAFPSQDLVRADPTIFSALYDKYIGMLTRAAQDPEADEAAFSTITGPWALDDKAAYNCQAAAWVAYLCAKADDPDRMKKALNTRTFRLALESAEYAKSNFPGITGWAKVLQTMRLKAISLGHSPALIDLWIATRDIKLDNAKNVVHLDLDSEALLAAIVTPAVPVTEIAAAA